MQLCMFLPGPQLLHSCNTNLLCMKWQLKCGGFCLTPGQLPSDLAAEVFCIMLWVMTDLQTAGRLCQLQRTGFCHASLKAWWWLSTEHPAAAAAVKLKVLPQQQCLPV